MKDCGGGVERVGVKGCRGYFRGEQVCSDNDASEVVILGHFGTFWDNSEDFFDELGAFKLFSQSDHFLP